MSVRFLPEWEHQEAVVMALPDEHTDWAYMLEEVIRCYKDIAEGIINSGEKLILLCRNKKFASECMAKLPQDSIIYVEMPINDTWTRDYGFISVENNGEIKLLDFGFNGWGLKFASNNDNLANLNLCKLKYISIDKYVNYRDFVLEGGSLETDGKGTLLTTSKCLCSDNRNGGKSKEEIEAILCKRLGINHFLWLDYGYLAGDDTDSHIDTLARLCPNDSILYVGCRDIDDEHFEELLKMKAQLMTFRTSEGNPYNLIELPIPDPIYDDAGERIPATYANYLVLNDRVLLPTYNQPNNDILATHLLKVVFADKEIIPIDCTALIKQHGSLHCSTMQVPKDALNI